MTDSKNRLKLHCCMHSRNWCRMEQTKKLTVTADAADNLTGESAAFAASPPRELTF